MRHTARSVRTRTRTRARHAPGAPDARSAHARPLPVCSSCEPSDALKGAIARSLMYMAVRYDGSGDDVGPGESPQKESWRDLELSDVATSAETIVDWHNQFPPTSHESLRNMAVASFQGIGNPFIEDPTRAGCVDFSIAAVNPTPPPPGDDQSKVFINEVISGPAVVVAPAPSP